MALIQVVNARDRPIRGGTVAEARREGLFHRIVRVMVEDETGDVLLQQRALHLDNKPGFWDCSASGHVDEGESYEQAALRELAEELNLTAEKLEKLDEYQSYQTTNGWVLNRFNAVFRVRLPGALDSSAIRFEPNEVAQVQCFSPPELRALLADANVKLADGLRKTLETFYR